MHPTVSTNFSLGRSKAIAAAIDGLLGVIRPWLAQAVRALLTTGGPTEYVRSSPGRLAADLAMTRLDPTAKRRRDRRCSDSSVLELEHGP
jgi:hypothetical protein